MRKTPFGKIKKRLVPVFPHTIAGMVNLISTGYPDPNIFPQEIQEAERNAGTIQYLLNAAAMRLAKEAQVNPIQAKKMFAPEENTQEIVYDYTMYLNEAELNRLYENLPQTFQREAQIRQAVTLMMRYRVAKCANIINVNPLMIDTWFDIRQSDRVIVTANHINAYVEFYDPQTEQLGLSGLRNLENLLNIGDSIAFVSSSGDYLMGDEDWSEEDSLALKAIQCNDGTSAFDAVYQFFLTEVSGNSRNLQDTGEDVSMGEFKNGSQNLLAATP